MELQKINVKFFAEEKAPIPLTAFIDIFHSWIQATDGIYLDVADYSHMQAGPGVVLVAHQANVSIDQAGGRRGLLYSRKSPLEGSNEEKLRQVFRAALEHCRRLEEEPALKGDLKFRVDEVEIIINDRRIAPNTEESYAALKVDVEQALSRIYGSPATALERDTDARKRLSVRIKTASPADSASLLARLEGEDKNGAVRV
ncbi:MAG TPA: hypothetical protein VFU31_18470 [Candidatus Binatia bacterium]|nr:hypothetical protein [Candidatus Binatia bacterium]